MKQWTLWVGSASVLVGVWTAALFGATTAAADTGHAASPNRSSATGKTASSHAATGTRQGLGTSRRTPAASAPAPTKSAKAIPSPPTFQSAARLMNSVGSAVLTLLGHAIEVATGSPVLPAGSTVTVRRTSLTLPIGDGEKVTADWYFPENYDSSTRLVYLQHGFMATGAMYSYTAANLAETTNSIVVVPSLSSDFLDPDANWLNGAPMEQAVADLFAGNRQALTDSASTALGETVTLPTEFVLAGHSAGGTLVMAAAGDMVDNGAIDDLAGIVLLDAVDPQGSNQFQNALTKLTGANYKPVLLMSSEPYFWNREGNVAGVLQTARPDTFNGVKLVGGRHIDYLQGGNPFIQFSEYLTAGFSKQQNIDAAQIIAAGWIEDMFDGTDNGLTGSPGEQISIPTPAGTATAQVLPIAPHQPGLIDGFFNAALNFLARNFFVYTPLED
jgi:pimeloyl-ACP methyl ester carboxylesterase